MWDSAEYIVMLNKCYYKLYHRNGKVAVWKCYIIDLLAFVLIYVKL